MRKIKLILFLLLSLAALPGLCLGATYYVDANNGNDSNSGTSAAPWQTLDRAYTWYSGDEPKIQEGDTVLFRDGNYGTFYESTNINPGQDYLFYRSNWITYKADTGHSPALTSIDIKNLDKWDGAGNGSSYLSFEGFAIQDGVLIRDTSYVRFVNCDLQRVPDNITGYYQPYFAVNTPCLYIINSEYFTFQNNEVSNATRGISIQGNHFIIKGNEIHHISEDGIGFVGVGSNDILIDNNLIYDHRPYSTGIEMRGEYTGGTFSVGDVVTQGTRTGIVAKANGTANPYVYVTSQEDENGLAFLLGTDMVGPGGVSRTVTFADNAHTDCIQLDSGAVFTNIVITNNIADRKRAGKDAGEGTVDGQGVKIAGVDQNVSCTIENNLFIGGTPFFSFGLKNAKFNNNTCYGGPPEGSGTVFRNDGGSSTFDEVHNNIIEHMFVFADSGSNTITVTSHGNNVFGTPSLGNALVFNGTELQDVVVDGLFVDASGGDFRLVEGSTAIDFGDPNHTTETDILGFYRDSKPDAGCYEYGASDNEPLEPEADVSVDIATTLLSVRNNVIKSGGNSSAIIYCDLIEAGNLSVKLYDSKGKEIIVLHDGYASAGRYEFTWSATDVGSGIYIVQMVRGGYKETKKIAVVK